jgi:hypothetical protein
MAFLMAFAERKSYWNLWMAFLTAYLGGISVGHFLLEFVNSILGWNLFKELLEFEGGIRGWNLRVAF